MSLLGFQRAMAALAASKALCAQVALDPEPFLDGFDLTEVERRRVHFAAGAPGMQVNLALYRSNRIGPIFTLLRRTCFLLGADLRGIADRFWARHPKPDFMTRREVPRFARFLQELLDTGEYRNPYAAEIMRFELAFFDLGLMPRQRLVREAAAATAAHPDGDVGLHPVLRVVRFTHEPDALLDLIQRRVPPPYALPEGEFYVLVDGRGENRQVINLDVVAGRLLYGMQEGYALPNEGEAQVLLNAGLAVRRAA